MKSVGFALKAMEELLGLPALLQIPNKPSYGTRNNGQERQGYALLAYEPLGFKFSVVNATRFQVVAGI